MMPHLTVAFVYQTIEQLVRSMIRVEALGISWWTIDRGPAHRRRSSGMIPAAQIEEIAIEGLGPDQTLRVRRTDGTELKIPIEPIKSPDQFVSDAQALLGISPANGPNSRGADLGP